MNQDDDFKPKLGKIRAGGGTRGRKFLHQVLAAANRAGGQGPGTRTSKFHGGQIGRGAGIGRMLSSRDRHAAFRSRRVVVKSRIVKLAGKGVAGAKAHLRYIQRDGVTRDGALGQLYGAEQDRLDGKPFLDRATDLVTLDLGPRSDLEIENRLRHDIEQERLTSIDRRLLREVDAERLVWSTDKDAFQQSLRAGRLQKLKRLGLAEEAAPGRWRLADDLETTLRRMGERGDILKTMSREMTAKGLARSGADLVLHEPAAPPTRPIVGRLGVCLRNGKMSAKNPYVAPNCRIFLNIWSRSLKNLITETHS